MTITIPDAALVWIGPVSAFLLIVSVFLGLAYVLMASVNDKAAEQREKTIQFLRDQVAKMKRDKDAITAGFNTANATIRELNGKIDQVAAIFGWDDEPDEEEDEEEESSEEKPTHLYACSVVSKDGDDYIDDHLCLHIRASSRDEARGVACRMAEKEYDEYEIKWSGTVIEPEVS